MFPGVSLAWRFFMVVLLIISIMAISVYIWSVPLVEDRVYAIERNSARLALNNVYELADKAYKNLEGYREQTLEASKHRLSALVELTGSQIDSTLAMARQHGMDEQQALTATLEGLRRFRYGNDGYLWVVDHQARMLSHPDERYNGRTIASFNSPESGVIANMIATAIREGEGFYQYQWHRPGADRTSAKLSFVRNYPQWGLVIGSGLYLDDLEDDIKVRRQQAVEEIRQALASIRIASTGYLFVFDANGEILAHPNQNIDRTNASDLIDPASGRPIVEELIEVADTGQELHYLWDRPDDPGNYRYEKLSIVRRMESLDWYICATVYVEELQQSAQLLGQRIIGITAVAVLLALILALYFINRISQPLQLLVRTSERIQRGDLSARSGIQGKDEIGMLATTFDSMVGRLRNNIETLDQTIQERTHELARLEERQRLILDALPAQIACLDQNLIYQFVNQGYAHQFGLAKTDFLGKPIYRVIPEAMLATINDALSECLAGKTVTYEYEFEDHGDRRVTRRQLIPDYDQRQQLRGVLVLSLDITHEREAERRLLEAQRMQATGELAGGLAHDFNNLLTIILGNLGALRRKPDHHPEHLEPALRATRRATDITARLLAFARRQALSPSPVELRSLISETLELLGSTLPGNLRLQFIPTSSPVVLADPGQLENCLINLIINARDACIGNATDNPEIRLYLEQRHLDDNEAYDELVSAGAYAEIRICDNGPGFSATALERAFEPFFTTRPGSGSGLGLSMVFGFVKQSGGYIRVRNLGPGATIEMLLPIHSDQPDAALPEPRPEKTLNDKALALLVEDDPDIRQMIRLWLVAAGWVVLESNHLDEARQLLEQLPELALLITDVQVPGTGDGLQLARHSRQQYPELAILVISSQLPEGLAITETASFLAKPFDQTTLMATIQRLYHPAQITASQGNLL